MVMMNPIYLSPLKISPIAFTANEYADAPIPVIIPCATGNTEWRSEIFSVKDI